MVERDVAEKSGGNPAAQAVLLVGAGRFAREVGAALATLSGLDAEGRREREPWRELGVGDLEELLAQRPLEGVLILESGRVPGEDIGFVRRFLERHPGWKLVVVGEDRSVARPLLALDRARWLGWPPDLEELRTLLAPPAERPPARAVATPPPVPGPAREERTGRKSARRPPAVANGGVELGSLLEELLAAAALQGESTPRFQFRGEPGPVLYHERALLQEGLGGLVEFARQCAGGTGLVRAEVDPNGEGVRVRLDFPRGGLPEKELPTLLEHPPAGLEPPLDEGLTAARGAAVILRELGGKVELAGAEEGRVRCEVRLGAQPPGAAPRASKPEDPFA